MELFFNSIILFCTCSLFSNILVTIQFADETFDAIVDKGGLDALMEPELGSRLGNLYLSEVCDSLI